MHPEIAQLIRELEHQQRTDYCTLSFEYTSKVSYQEHYLELNLLIQLLENQVYQNQLVKNGKIRFKKRTSEEEQSKVSRESNDPIIFTNLPRSVQIFKDDSGKYLVILEAKSKIASGREDPNKKVINGSFKTCKPSFVLNIPIADNPKKQAKIGDLDFTYVTLVIKDPDEDRIKERQKTEKLTSLEEARKKEYITVEQEIITEVNLSNNFGVHMDFIKSPSTTKQEGKIRLYAKRGDSLKDILINDDKYNLLSTEDKNNIFLSTVKELDYLHSQEKYHKDIKPDNLIIFRDRNGKYYTKFCDFGFCSVITNHQISGSPPYIPLEVLQNIKNITPVNSNIYFCKMDIWALGLIALQLFHRIPNLSNSNFCLNYNGYLYVEICKIKSLLAKDSFLSELIAESRYEDPNIKNIITIYEQHFYILELCNNITQYFNRFFNPKNCCLNLNNNVTGRVCNFINKTVMQIMGSCCANEDTTATEKPNSKKLAIK